MTAVASADAVAGFAVAAVDVVDVVVIGDGSALLLS